MNGLVIWYILQFRHLWLWWILSIGFEWWNHIFSFIRIEGTRYHRNKADTYSLKYLYKIHALTVLYWVVSVLYCLSVLPSLRIIRLAPNNIISYYWYIIQIMLSEKIQFFHFLAKWWCHAKAQPIFSGPWAKNGQIQSCSSCSD